MFNESKTALWLILLAAGSALTALAIPQGEKSYRDYPEWKMLPRCDDFEDEAAESAYQRLVDKGESGHEGLLAIVRECEDPQLACLALSILRASGGNKRLVVEELKEVLAERLPTAQGDEEWLVTAIAEALAVMGDESDMEALAPMLSHPVWRVRVIGARCIGKCGDLHAVEALELARSRDGNNLVLNEIDKAIASIESRLAVQNADANDEPSPSP